MHEAVLFGGDQAVEDRALLLARERNLPTSHRIRSFIANYSVGQMVGLTAQRGPLALVVDNPYFEYAGLHPRAGTSHCRLRLYRGEGGRVLAISSELPGNTGTSITNWAEHLAHQVFLEQGRPAHFLFIEHYPASRANEPDNNYSVVSYRLDSQGRPRDASWHFVAKSIIEQVIGSPLK